MDTWYVCDNKIAWVEGQLAKKKKKSEKSPWESDNGGKS